MPSRSARRHTWRAVTPCVPSCPARRRIPPMCHRILLVVTRRSGQAARRRCRHGGGAGRSQPPVLHPQWQTTVTTSHMRSLSPSKLKQVKAAKATVFFNIDQDKYNSSFGGRAPPLNYSTHYKHIVSFPAPKPANECSHAKGEPRFGWTRQCAKDHS